MDSIHKYDTLETENDTDTVCSASETDNYNYIHPGILLQGKSSPLCMFPMHVPWKLTSTYYTAHLIN